MGDVYREQISHAGTAMRQKLSVCGYESCRKNPTEGVRKMNLTLRFPHELHADACVCASTSGGSVRSLSSHSSIRPIGHDRIKASRPMRMVE